MILIHDLLTIIGQNEPSLVIIGQNETLLVITGQNEPSLVKIKYIQINKFGTSNKLSTFVFIFTLV